MEEKVSWQGHLGGSITGVLLAAYYYDGPIKPKNKEQIDLALTDKTQEQINDLQQQYKNNRSTGIHYTYTKTRLD